MAYNQPIPHELDPKHYHKHIKCSACLKCKWAENGIGCMYGGPFTDYELKEIKNNRTITT